MSVGGKVTSSPAATHCRWTSSTSSTQTDIHAPLSETSSPSGPNVEAFAPLPRPPWPSRQRKISAPTDPTAPKLAGVPQSQSFFQPHFSNHAKLAAMSDTFNIGVTCRSLMRGSIAAQDGPQFGLAPKRNLEQSGRPARITPFIAPLPPPPSQARRRQYASWDHRPPHTRRSIHTDNPGAGAAHRPNTTRALCE